MSDQNGEGLGQQNTPMTLVPARRITNGTGATQGPQQSPIKGMISGVLLLFPELVKTF